MAESEGKLTGKRAVTPLVIIALFVSLTEAVLGLALPRSAGGIQVALTAFVIGFPLLILGVFFAILWFKPWVLYPPREFGPQTDVGAFVEAMGLSLSKGRVDRIEQELWLRISSKLEEVLQPRGATEVEATKREVKEKLAEAFQTLRARAAPSSIGYDWGPFVRRIAELEGQHRFLSVKWLNEKRLVGNPDMQEALQVALTNGILESYYVDNPKNKEFPVHACRLNPTDPIVSRILLTRE